MATAAVAPRGRRRGARRAPQRRRHARRPPRRRRPARRPRRRAHPRARSRRCLPDVPTLADVLDVCRGRWSTCEVKDPDPRATEAWSRCSPSAPRRTSGPTTSSCRRSTSRPSTGSHAAAPDVPTGALSFGRRTRRDARDGASRTGYAAVHPDVWTLLAHDVDAFVAARARRRCAGERVDGQRRRPDGGAARRGRRRRDDRRRRRSTASASGDDQREAVGHVGDRRARVARRGSRRRPARGRARRR